MDYVYMIIPSFKHCSEGLIILLMLWNTWAISYNAGCVCVPVGTHRCTVNLIGKYWIFQLLHRTSLLYQVACIYCFVMWRLLSTLIVYLAYYSVFCIRKKKVLPDPHTDLFYALKHEIWVIFVCHTTAVAGHKLRVPCTALACAFLLLWENQR